MQGVGLVVALLRGRALMVLCFVLSMLSVSAPTMPVSTASGIATRLSGLKLMNYYPAQNGWSDMWTNWNPGTIDADFQRIRALHGDTVRITVPAYTFGYPHPRPIMLNQLAALLTIAGRHGLRVQLTLFDWWHDYGDIAGSQHWAHAVLAPHAGQHSIAFVELQNEIDPTDPQAMAWTRRMIPYVRQVAGGIPVTVSVSGQKSIGGMQFLVEAVRATPPDFYTLHYYSPAPLAYATFRRAVQIVAPVPLYVGETGISTCTCNQIQGLSAVTAALEEYQDQYYRTVEYATQLLGLPPAAPWILYDFAPGAIPAGAVSGPADYDYGLFHLDGTAKPAAASQRALFGGSPIDLSFNNGFEKSFQTSNGRLPAEWLVYHQSQAQFAVDTEHAHSGTASARISASGGAGDAAPAFSISPVAPIIPGQTYTAAAWARGLHATGITQIALDWFDASGTLVAENVSAELPHGTTTWTRLDARAAAPTGAAYVQIRLESAANQGTSWFDDVSFNRVSQGESVRQTELWPVMAGEVRASPPVVVPGQEVQFSVRLTSRWALRRAIVDFSVVDSDWVPVGQSYQSNVDLAARTPRSFSATLKVPSAGKSGTYRLVINVFNSSWNTIYGRNQAITFVVEPTHA
ncbi:MAG: glycosyl hydrolase [Chloroflexi bacterium]|nr:glycosyl hydrolase [Chloroflexota bacterium]